MARALLAGVLPPVLVEHADTLAGFQHERDAERRDAVPHEEPKLDDERLVTTGDLEERAVGTLSPCREQAHRAVRAPRERHDGAPRHRVPDVLVDHGRARSVRPHPP